MASLENSTKNSKKISCLPFSNYSKKLKKMGDSPVALSFCTQLWQPGVHWYGSWVGTCTPLLAHAVAGIPHIKQRKIGSDVSSGPVFLSKKRRIGGRCQLSANLPQKKKKRTVKRMEIQAMCSNYMPAKHLSDKGHVFRIHKELST